MTCAGAMGANHLHHWFYDCCELSLFLTLGIWLDVQLDALLHGHSYTAHAVGCSAAVTSVQYMSDPRENANLLSNGRLQEVLFFVANHGQSDGCQLKRPRFVHRAFYANGSLLWGIQSYIHIRSVQGVYASRQNSPGS